MSSEPFRFREPFSKAEIGLIITAVAALIVRFRGLRPGQGLGKLNVSGTTCQHPAFKTDSAGKRINISGKILLQDSQIPICAMVLANGQYMFTCYGTGSYVLNIPLDSNGQYKVQVYADGFAPITQKFDEFSTTTMSYGASCRVPVIGAEG